jgi:hypothetical protein
MQPDLNQHWRAYNPTVHLCGADLNGQDWIVTIKSFNLEKVGDEGQNKPIIYFEEEVVAGKNKGMICGSRVSQTISKLLGSPVLKDWIGKKIVIFGIEEKNFGQVKDVVRVRPFIPKPVELETLVVNSDRYKKLVNKIIAGELTIDTARNYAVITPEVEKAIAFEIDARKAENA